MDQIKKTKDRLEANKPRTRVRRHNDETLKACPLEKLSRDARTMERKRLLKQLIPDTKCADLTAMITILGKFKENKLKIRKPEQWIFAHSKKVSRL